MMKVAIGLPTVSAGVTARDIRSFAEAADRGPYSSLAVTDRLAYRTLEALTTLSAAAAVTERVRLITTVLVATIREPALFAKQVATLDVLSGGRFTLGIGVGSRPDDFETTGYDFHDRGRSMNKIIETMRKVWEGEQLLDGAGAIGPMPTQPGGPPVLLSGRSDAAIRRAARIGDGFITPPISIQAGMELTKSIRDAWQAAGRNEKPMLVGSSFFVLAPDGKPEGDDYIRNYYSFLPEERLAKAVKGLLHTPEQIKETILAYDEAGFDEFCFWPTTNDVDDVRRLAAIVQEVQDGDRTAAPAEGRGQTS